MSTSRKKIAPKKITKTTPAAKAVPPAKPLKLRGKGRTLSSKTVFKGNVFTVTSDQVQEPGGVTARRDVIRHNGSVVVLAVDTATNPSDPGILLIKQWRHAADQFLLELPAGRIEPGEKLIPAGKRELIEETGYRAKKWSKHVRYFASPGFLSEAMNVLLAEDLTLGEATPEDDERIEIHMTPLSEVLAMIRAGKILDGKTLVSVLLYEEQRREEQRRATRP
jgi:ADP-ribose pyrophosphatase